MTRACNTCSSVIITLVLDTATGTADNGGYKGSKIKNVFSLRMPFLFCHGTRAHGPETLDTVFVHGVCVAVSATVL